jgi:uncharacterized protein with von Willebrand factor type A (vWA) domain
VEVLMAELEPMMDETSEPQRLRGALRTGSNRASVIVGELRDSLDGLEHVAFGHLPGGGTAVSERRAYDTSKALARRIREDHRLQRIALLAGRFKRIAAVKQRQKIKHGADEVADVEQGADLGRLLPVELAKLVHPRLRLSALRDLVERRAMQYRLSGAESLGKGPLVVCLDKSGSMDGRPDEWATAVALALLDVARRQHRPFALLGFDDTVKFEALVETSGELPEAGLSVSCGGGTNIDRVVGRALEIIAEHPGSLKKADAVLITDGESSSDRAMGLRERAQTLGVTVLGFGIGVSAESLTPWCDEAHAVTDLTRIDEKSADALFGQ